MKRGFYYINTIIQRCYYLTGDKAGNKWIDIGYDGESIIDPEWVALNWMCLPDDDDLIDATQHETNPTEFELNLN